MSDLIHQIEENASQSHLLWFLSVPMRMSLLQIQNGKEPILPWKPCQNSKHSSEDRNLISCIKV
jgi:hypothetical protein